MWLVDAGDYGSDGNSELVFSIDDYNHGGYKLFYESFSTNLWRRFPTISRMVGIEDQQSPPQ
jgi:hypothetical protein